MNIFEDEEDNHQFINTLDRMRVMTGNLVVQIVYIMLIA